MCPPCKAFSQRFTMKAPRPASAERTGTSASVSRAYHPCWSNFPGRNPVNCPFFGCVLVVVRKMRCVQQHHYVQPVRKNKNAEAVQTSQDNMASSNPHSFQLFSFVAWHNHFTQLWKKTILDTSFDTITKRNKVLGIQNRIFCSFSVINNLP